MRWLVRALLALVALVVLVAVVALLALPRLVESEALRGRIEAAAREATGREVEWRSLSVGILPPRLVVERVELGGGSEPEASAEHVALRLAVLPLLARRVVVDSLVVEGLEVELVRGPRGLELPIRTRPGGLGKGAPAKAEKGARAAAPGASAKPGAAASAGGKPGPGEAEGGEGGPPVAFAVAQLELHGGRVRLVDRTLHPPVTWTLRKVEALARAESVGGPMALHLRGELESGGELELRGRVSQQGSGKLELELREVDLVPLGSYLGPGRRLAGRAQGSVKLEGALAAPDRIEGDLTLAGTDFAQGDLVVRGPLRLRFQAQGALAALEGKFEVDAKGAELRWGEAVHKPPGTEAHLSGHWAPDQDGQLRIEGLRLQLRNLKASGSAAVGPRGRASLTLSASPFDVAGWEELVPALAPLAPRGRLGLEAVRVTFAPLAVRGRVQLDALELRPPGRARIELRGVLVAEGERIVGQGLQAQVAEQPVTVDLVLAPLLPRPKLELRFEGEKLESEALVQAFLGRSDVLFGPLGLQAAFSLAPAGERPLLETLRGRVRFAIAPGRLRGVSLLRSTFDRLGAFGEAALLAGALRGGKTLQHFYEDRFQSLSGSFAIADGVASTRDLRLVYRDYTVTLRGRIGLADGALDLTGELAIDERIDAALSGEGAAPAQASGSAAGGAAAPGASASGGSVSARAAAPPPSPSRRKIIPLAHVGGTVASPRVDLTRSAVAAFVSTYAAARPLQRLERKLDRRLGPGAGQGLVGALEQLLGGGSKPPAQEKTSP